MAPLPRKTAGAANDSLTQIDGESLARAFEGGAAALRQHADALNAINVFPVPDGDTGTNMSMTMRAAIDEIVRADTASAGAVAKAAAQGALMGAKGNSGVILSQIIGGFATAAGDANALDAVLLASALQAGRDAAYNVVSNPREGTILTAIAAAAAGALDARDVDDAFARATVAAADAAARTPDLMPMLKEAGVVDAGAQGLAIMLDGMLRAWRGDEPMDAAGDLGHIDAAWLDARTRLHDEGTQAGFCTEFVIEGDALDAAAIRAHLGRIGDSLLVVGGGDLVRVHVHTPAPQDALAYARTLGTVTHEKADDMEAQFARLAARSDGPPAATALAVIAVAAGDGIEELFRSLGARVVRGGQTMNPSAGDIRAAIEATGARAVIVLPNNGNIVLAAQQAASGLAIEAHVVPTRSIPQGVAALVAMNPELPAADNVAAMQEAIGAVCSGEVTLAARTTRIDGIDVAQGQPIALVEDRLLTASDTIAAAVRVCVEAMLDGRTSAIVTLYAGSGETPDMAEAIASRLRDALGVDVEVVAGGQPHYPYLIGVE